MASGKKILVVEDDPAVATTLTAALEAEGYSVAEASSAEQALERLPVEDFPVVVTDIFLRSENGAGCALSRARPESRVRCHLDHRQRIARNRH